MPKDYQERKERRIERYRERADKAEANSNALQKAASDMAHSIPLGQPILVGHHSEKRDRAFRDRMGRKFDKSIEEDAKATHYREKARAAEENTSISSDDPEAIKKLTAKIARLEQEQTWMKKVNKIIRAKPRNEQTAKKVEALKELGYKAETIYYLFHPVANYMPIGFPSYKLSNNSQNIKRLKVRLETLQNARKAETTETEHEGFSVVENTEENRIQIIFPGKPEADVRKLLKDHGFRWSPKNSAWQRHLNDSGRIATSMVVKDLTN